MIKDKELMDLIKERYSAEAIYPNGYLSPRYMQATQSQEDEDESNEDGIDTEDNEMNEEEYRPEEEEYDESLQVGEGFSEGQFDQNEVDSTGSNQNYDDSQNEMAYDELSEMLDSTIEAN